MFFVRLGLDYLNWRYNSKINHSISVERAVMMIREHERVALTVDLPERHLQAGDVGTVVHVYTTSKAYGVEFFTLDGQTLDVITVESEQLRPVGNLDVMHARPMR